MLNKIYKKLKSSKITEISLKQIHSKTYETIGNKRMNMKSSFATLEEGI